MGMAQIDPAQVLREGHAAFNDRDRDRLMQMVGENVAWHTPGGSALAGTRNGRDELWNDFFAHLWEAPIKVEDRDVSGTGEHAVAVFDLIVGDGRWKGMEVVRVTNGQVTERWAFLDRQAEFDHFMQQMGERKSS